MNYTEYQKELSAMENHKSQKETGECWGEFNANKVVKESISEKITQQQNLKGMRKQAQ